MTENIVFPSDENGDVLRRMAVAGDDLTRPRIVDFYFAFPERKQAIAFAEMVDERDLEVAVSYYGEREMWQTTVKRYMKPTHEEITSLELSLSEKASSLGGEAD